MESQTVNQLIKPSRKLRGLTQQDLANQAGIYLFLNKSSEELFTRNK